MSTLLRSFAKLYQHTILGLFTSINLETYGYCNRKCEFCFNSDKFPKRPVGMMKDEVFYKVINELGSLDYAGRISPHLYGEPLMDKRLVEHVRYMRQTVPKAHLRFSSNGDFLNEELLVKLIESGIDRVFITNYDDFDKPELNSLQEKYPKYVSIRHYKDIRLINRAGVLFGKESEAQKMPCFRPTEQLIINWQGEVLLCCNDYYAQYSFGNVMDDSIVNIWNSPELKKVKRALHKRGSRENFDICKNCDH